MQENVQGPSPMPSNIRPSSYVTLDTFAATADPSVPSAMETTIGIHSGPGESPPGKGAPIEDRMEFLHSQLDSFGGDKRFMRRFTLLGYSHRRQGGVTASLAAFKKPSLRFRVCASSQLLVRPAYRRAAVNRTHQIASAPHHVGSQDAAMSLLALLTVRATA